MGVHKDGSFVIVWEDYKDFFDSDIRAKKFNVEGQAFDSSYSITD